MSNIPTAPATPATPENIATANEMRAQAKALWLKACALDSSGPTFISKSHPVDMAVDLVIEALGNTIDDVDRVRREIFVAVSNQADNHEAGRPKFLTKEQRKVLVDGIFKVREYRNDIDRNSNVLKDAVLYGYNGWEHASDNAIIVDALIENPIFGYILNDIPAEKYMSLLQVLANPTVLETFTSSMLGAEGNDGVLQKDDYLETVDNLHTELLSLPGQTEENKTLINALHRQIVSTMDEFIVDRDAPGASV